MLHTAACTTGIGHEHSIAFLTYKTGVFALLQEPADWMKAEKEVFNEAKHDANSGVECQA
jgi:hypothetical protein